MTTKQILTILNEDDDLKAKFTTYLTNADLSLNTSTTVTDWWSTSKEVPKDGVFEKILVLMEHTGENYSECEGMLETDYEVYTEEEAKDKFEDCIRDVIENADVDYGGWLVPYIIIDTEAVLKDIGRGIFLSTDGVENKITLNGTQYYVYEQY
jgi:hypothetical protein